MELAGRRDGEARPGTRSSSLLKILENISQLDDPELPCNAGND
jgi:hypothetical protein